MMLRIQMERMAGGFFPTTREYFRRFGLTEERVRRAKQDVLDPAPRPDEPRRRDRERGSRRALLGDPRPGHERGRGPHGRALPAARRQRARRPREPAAARRAAASSTPSQRLDAPLDVLVEDGVVARVGEGLRARDARARRRQGPRRCAPASSTCTRTCASPAARTRRRSRRAPVLRRRAASPLSARCPTPSPVNDTARDHARDRREGARRGPRARVPDRRDHARAAGPGARRVRRPAARRAASPSRTTATRSRAPA